MRLEELPHGQIEEIRVAPVASHATFSNRFAMGAEVRLGYLPLEDTAWIELSGDRVLIRGAAKADALALTDVATRNLPRLAWIADAGLDRLVVRVHTFLHERVVGALRVGVDEKVVEGLARKNKVRTANDAVAWLTDQLLLPAEAGGMRAVATGEDDRTFVLHGRGVRAVLRRVPRPGSGDAVLVERVVRSAAREGDAAPVLLTGDILFVDATVVGALAVEGAAELAALAASGSSFLQAWRRYGDLEGEAILGRARRAGWLPYARAARQSDGKVQFFLAEDLDLAAVDRFRAALGDDGQRLEAVATVPAILRTSTPWAVYAAAPRPKGGAEPPRFRGRLEFSRRERTVTLEPAGEDSDNPPPTGVIVLSLRGDETRLERRKEAQRLIQEARCPMPQLGFLLEGQPVAVPRRGTLAPISRAVTEKVFGTRSPTLTQLDALHVALNTPDIALVQGPPGTGKTTLVVALVERLQEIWDTTDGVQGRVLLSGFQHDAVHNAVQRMHVNGLPAVKFGQKAGESGWGDRTVQRWCEERAAEIREKNGGRRGTAAPERVVRDAREGHRLAPGTLEQTAAQLRTVAAQLATAGNPALAERARAFADELEARVRVAREPDPALERLIRRARALRTTPGGFADDGPRAARLLRVELERAGRLSSEAAQLLDGAATNAEAPHLARMASLQRELLLELRPARPEDVVPRVLIDVLALYDSLEAALQARRRTSVPSADDAVADLLDALDNDVSAVTDAIITYTSVFAATCQQSARKELVELKNNEPYDTVIVDEAARANPLDLFVPLARAKRRIVLVGDHRQLPHLLDSELQRELEESFTGTPGERAAELLKQSMFERLFLDLKAREARDGVCRTVTLDEQYRMHPALGRLVSRFFYDDFGEGFRSPRPASEFVHGLPGGEGPARWLAVPLDRGAEERDGTSWRRPAEATLIAAELRTLMDSEPGKKLTFGVITYYRAQVRALENALERLGLGQRDEEGVFTPRAPYAELELSDHRRVERLRVGTVDQFQGMEFDVVFLSLVRSNRYAPGEPDTWARKFGRLLTPNLLCVSMSRQKRLLVAAGDAAMLDGAGARALPALAALRALAGGGGG